MASRVTYDNTVLIGDGASHACGRGWVAQLVSLAATTSSSHKGSRACIFDLTLAEYERCVSDASQLAGLQKLQITPHAFRHGGASADANNGCRSFEAIRSRGQWAAEKSVARYRKTGTYSRQNARLSKSQQISARTLATTLPPKLMQIARDPSIFGRG